MTAVFGGLDVGSAVGLVLCGPLIKHVGWPSVFYLFAGLGLLWTLIFPRLGPDEPDELVPSELQPDSPGMRWTPSQTHTVCCLNAQSSAVAHCCIGMQQYCCNGLQQHAYAPAATFFWRDSEAFIVFELLLRLCLFEGFHTMKMYKIRSNKDAIQTDLMLL